MSSEVMTKLFSDMNEIFSKSAKFERTEKTKEEFISSVYCTACDGSGETVIDHRAWISGGNVYEEDVMGQCLNCEELHQQELKADRLHDEMKGN